MREEVVAKLLKLCKKDYLTAKALAEQLEMPLNTVRAKYVYLLVQQGKLVLLYPDVAKRVGQAYKAAH